LKLKKNIYLLQGTVLTYDVEINDELANTTINAIPQGGEMDC